MAAILILANPVREDRHTLLACEYYQGWQAAFDDAEDAFRAWCAAPYGRKPDACGAYRAAADREDAAAAFWMAA